VNKRSPQHDPRRSQFVVEQPALLGQPPTVSHEAAILAYDPVARDQDRQMIGGDEPAYLPGMEVGGAGHILVGPGLTQGNLPKCFEYSDLGRGEVEPALEMLGIGEGAAGPLEVLVEPA